MDLRRNALRLIVTSLIVGGCYTPNIAPGGFSCGEGGACPQGQHCVNSLCTNSNVVDASPDKPICKSTTSISMPTCNDGPATGQICNPACQTGCDACGWCGVGTGGASKCMVGTEGSKDIGAVCDLSMDSDCKAGLYCQPECQNTTGRCYQLCDKSSSNPCVAGSTCGTIARTNTNEQLPFSLCSLVDSCDPIMQMGCPQGFGCYPNGGTQTECDCPGANVTGASCSTFIYDCVSGDQCVRLASSGSSSCFVNCTQASGCAQGTCNVQPNSTYGSCM